MRRIAALILTCAVFNGAAVAQTAETARPDLADIMAGAQLRHFKLSYAGTLKNWPLAQYEVGQMRKNFASAAKFYPEYDKVPVEKLLTQYSAPALDRVEAAIKAKDQAAFHAAFVDLTQACNSCHQAAGLSFVKIRVPVASPFSNQLFEPER